VCVADCCTEVGVLLGGTLSPEINVGAYKLSLASE